MFRTFRFFDLVCRNTSIPGCSLPGAKNNFSAQTIFLDFQFSILGALKEKLFWDPNNFP